MINGKELPVAFSSTKLNATQSSWSTIEREAYAALLALKKYRSWIFGTDVCVLKGKRGCNDIRLAIDYRYVN